MEPNRNPLKPNTLTNNNTMKPIDRNPDINLDIEKIPPGMTLITGKNLMHTARSKKIPFGVASAAQDKADRRGYSRRETKGLIIRNEDVERFNGAVAGKVSHQKGAAA